MFSKLIATVAFLSTTVFASGEKAAFREGVLNAFTQCGEYDNYHTRGCGVTRWVNAYDNPIRIGFSSANQHRYLAMTASFEGAITTMIRDDVVDGGDDKHHHSDDFAGGAIQARVTAYDESGAPIEITPDRVTILEQVEDILMTSYDIECVTNDDGTTTDCDNAFENMEKTKQANSFTFFAYPLTTGEVFINLQYRLVDVAYEDNDKNAAYVSTGISEFSFEARTGDISNADKKQSDGFPEVIYA